MNKHACMYTSIYTHVHPPTLQTPVPQQTGRGPGWLPGPAVGLPSETFEN